MEDKVRRHLQASDNISLLNEYCQKSGIALPRWTCTSKPKLGGYEHAVTLKLADQEFSHAVTNQLISQGLSNKNDAKKLVAEQAVHFFEREKVPFFLARPRNYVSLLQSLCQINGIAVPFYDVEASGSGYIATVSVSDRQYKSDRAYSQKKVAKDFAAQNAFNSLCQLPEFTSIFQLKGLFEAKSELVSIRTLNSDDSDKNSLSQKSYIDLLEKFVASKPEVAKPQFNYRTVATPEGQNHYRAQLIYDGKSYISGICMSQVEAQMEVAKQAYLFFNPDAETSSKMDSNDALKEEIQHIKKKMKS